MSDCTQTSPLIQSAVFAEKTFWLRPLTNVGTAGAGSGAGAAIRPGLADDAFGGSGVACAVPTIAAIATVTVSALACAKRLPKSIQTPLVKPSWRPRSLFARAPPRN